MRKLFTPILLFIFLFSILFSCKKTDAVQDETLLLTNRFFSVDPNAPKEIKAIAKALIKQNDQYNYLSSITKRAGYPRWDKARIANFDKGTLTARGGEEVSGEIVYIPFVKDSDNYVNSLLAVKMNAADTIYRMLYANSYRLFGYDTSDQSKWNARDVFNIFTSFDHSVFGHNKFWIRDPNLFKPANDSSYVIATRASGTTNRSVARTSAYLVEECGSWGACSYPGTAPPTTLAPARLAGECAIIEICTTYYYGGGGTTSSGGTNDGTTSGWTGTGGGTGATGGSGGDTGWYGEPSTPCASPSVQRTSFVQTTSGCESGWVPVETVNASDANFDYPFPGDDAEFVSANPYETDCKSFQFTKTGNYWQEAGVKKIKFKCYYVDPYGSKTWLDCEVNQVVIGLPSKFSSGTAANLAAKAVDYARKETYAYTASFGGTLTAAEAIQYFRKKLNSIVSEKGGTASVNGSGSPLVIFKEAESTFWTNPYDC